MQVVTLTIVRAIAMHYVISMEEDSPLDKTIIALLEQEQLNQLSEANDDQENTHQMQDPPREPIKKPFYLNEKLGTSFVNELNNGYDKTVYWRKELFSSPNRSSREKLYERNNTN